MINIIQNLNLKIKFCDLNQKTGSIDISNKKIFQKNISSSYNKYV